MTSTEAKIAAMERENLLAARLILADPAKAGIQHEWALRVLKLAEREQAAA